LTAAAAESRHILGIHVDGATKQQPRILGWARVGSSHSVCVASVNNVMVSHDDPSFLNVMNDADLVTPDGMPLAWELRWLGVSTPPASFRLASEPRRLWRRYLNQNPASSYFR